MKIVIDISEDEYRKVQDGRASVSMMRKTIRNGTPLPKGHGRLIDADALWESLKEHRYSDGFCTEHNIDYSINIGMAGIVIGDAPTIIEADKGEDNEDID